MEQIYLETSKILKAISDPKRLRIVDMLSCGEMGATEILEAFHISQPTLSHDMKRLIEAGIVTDRRDGKNIFYTLERKSLEKLCRILMGISSDKAGCICYYEDTKVGQKV